MSTVFFSLSLSLSSTPLEVFGMRNDVWGREKIVWFSAHRSWLFFKPRESRRRRLFSLLLLIDIGFCEEPSPHFVCQLPLLSSKLTFSLPRPLVFRRSDSKQRQLGDTCRAPFASPSWTTADKERGIKKKERKKNERWNNSSAAIRIKDDISPERITTSSVRSITVVDSLAFSLLIAVFAHVFFSLGDVLQLLRGRLNLGMWEPDESLDTFGICSNDFWFKKQNKKCV